MINEKMAPTKKLRKTNNIRQEDFISNLPGDVVSDILSRLPINDAVRTSVLSRNWKYKWTSIYNIDICPNISKSFYGQDGDATFADVVTRLLALTQNSRLKSFRLFLFYYSSYIEKSYIQKWMSDVLMRNVQNLDISIYNDNRLDSTFYFSGWGLLTELRLQMNCTLIVPLNNCFPNLKLLCLRGQHGGDIKIITTAVPDTAGRVIMCFPVLEVLRLRECQWLDVSSVEIQAPELISFSSRCSQGFKDYEIKISGPKLVTFEWSGYGILKNFVLNAPAVTHVCLSNSLIDETSALQTHKVLTKFPNMKCLSIASCTLQDLLCWKPMVVSFSFAQLKELEVCYPRKIEDVLEFLKVTPHLELLILNLHIRISCKLDSREALSSNTLGQLKEVKLLNAHMYQDRYALPMYFLKNAKNLKKMTISLNKETIRLNKEAFKRDVGDGKQFDKVEFIEKYSLGLKPKGSSCEIVVVEEKQGFFQYAGSWPKVITGDGKATQIVQTVQYRREF